MKRSQESKSKVKTDLQANIVTLAIRVQRGMIKFMKDHAELFEERHGTGTPEEYFEQALEQDFAAELDSLHLNQEEIYRKYGIAETTSIAAELMEKAKCYLKVAKQDPSLPQFKDETELTEFAVQEFLSKHSEA